MSHPLSVRLEGQFKQCFGRSPDFSVSAPGRVNLIGEHTDYNQGFVLPAAINYRTWVAASAVPGRQLSVIAWDMDQQSVVLDLDQPMVFDQDRPWANYLRGVVQQLRNRGYQLAGGQLLVAGDVPAGAGLSSSAALEIALIRALTRLSGETPSPQEAALMGQAAENEFVGCNCGIMDQLISACGQDSSALLIDCRDLTFRSVAIPEDWELLIVHSGVQRGLVESQYNARRQQCEAAAAFFGLESLRDLALDQLLAVEPRMDPLAFRRARHVLTENARTLAAADALERADMVALSRIMAESHISMRDDFDITVPAIDRLVEIIAGAGQGEVGVRMTGGGFGGCVLALGPRRIMPALADAVGAFYQRDTGCTPRLIPARASAGAFVG